MVALIGKSKNVGRFDPEAMTPDDFTRLREARIASLADTVGKRKSERVYEGRVGNPGKRIVNLETGESYPTVTDAAIRLGIPKGTVFCCLRRYYRCHGILFAYDTPEGRADATRAFAVRRFPGPSVPVMWRGHRYRTMKACADAAGVTPAAVRQSIRWGYRLKGSIVEKASGAA